jgi:hypothetical protein
MQHIVTAAVRRSMGPSARLLPCWLTVVTSPVHSDELAAKVGDIQAATRSGPCVETPRDEITIRSDDLNTETRWPEFTRQALELGVQSVLSFQLFVEGNNMGALDVYGAEVNAFDAEAENTGLLLASHAAIAMAASRDITNLRAGLQMRDIIGQAKGTLMERYRSRRTKRLTCWSWRRSELTVSCATSPTSLQQLVNCIFRQNKAVVADSLLRRPICSVLSGLPVDDGAAPGAVRVALIFDVLLEALEVTADLPIISPNSSAGLLH